MAALTPPVCEIEGTAQDSDLTATDGKSYSLSDIVGDNGMLIMFICNHCPLVLANLDKILRRSLGRQLPSLGGDEIGCLGQFTAVIKHDPACNGGDSGLLPVQTSHLAHLLVETFANPTTYRPTDSLLLVPP